MKIYLDEVISFKIDCSSGLVEHKHFRLPEQRSGQADELPLADTEVLTAFRHLVTEAGGQPLHKVLEMGVLKGAPHLLVLVLLERVQVDSERAGEKHRVLGNDGESGTERVQTQLGNVDAVDVDRASGRFDDAEQT